MPPLLSICLITPLPLPPSQALASLKPPQCVIYHELVFTAKPFMRHILGVDRPWLMDCRQRIGRASISALSGGGIQELAGSDNPLADHILKAAAEKEDEKAHAEAEGPKKPTQEGLDAARQRFLERKMAKKQHTGGGRR